MFGSILLTSSLSGWTHDTKIGDIFLSMMSFFKSYTGFSNNFENALNTISKCKKQPTFQLYLKHCVDTIPGCGKLWLEDHLITPIQRIPRLIMLLKDLIKRTGTCVCACHDARQSIRVLSRDDADGVLQLRVVIRVQPCGTTRAHDGGTIHYCELWLGKKKRGGRWKKNTRVSNMQVL